MPLINAPVGELRMEKSIVIDPIQAKNMEAKGIVLKSDEYIERDRGENLAPAQFVQEVVDANTAARLAAARGVTLAQSVDQAAGLAMAMPSGTPRGTSKLPAEILESFKKQPPIVPEMQPTTAAFDPTFIASVKEANERINRVGGTIQQRVPETASRQTLNETRPVNQNYYNPAPTGMPSLPNYTQYPIIPQAAPANVDYSVIAALMKEAVREVLKEVNLKEVVKEVLKEERENVVKTNINEKIEIKIGDAVFSGRILAHKSHKI